MISLNSLWVRGGFPDSFLARDDNDSLAFRRNFIRTCLERDVPQFGRHILAETLEHLWTMLAYDQGTLLNASKLASALSLSPPTVTGYIGLLVDLLLVRRLRPFHANVRKRLVKSPKIYVRDSGIVHALLGIADHNSLAGHPVVGASWEGFVIENLLSVAPAGTKASFYRTAAGAEMTLCLNSPGDATLGRSRSSTVSASLSARVFEMPWKTLSPSGPLSSPPVLTAIRSLKMSRRSVFGRWRQLLKEQ